MKKIFSAILLLFTLLNPFQSIAQWQWAQSGTSGLSWDEAYSITTDTAGNAYVIGMFSSSIIDFGGFTLTNTNPGTDDIFIVKYSPTGTPLWAKQAIGTDYDYGMAITSDPLGNIYVTGHYYSPYIVFDNDTLFNTAGVGTDIYTVKYSSSGNVIWARTGGGIGFDESTTVCTDATGNCYVAGEFYSPSLIFGSDTIYNSGTDTLDMFIVKYDPVGNVVWMRSAGGASQDAISGITCDKDGNVIITGSSGSPVCNFGALTLSNPGIFGYEDVFTVKYDSSGNAIWGRSGAGSIFESGAGVAADTSGNIYVTGTFSSVYLVFETDTLYNAHNTGGTSDLFLVKYNSSGTLLWARSAGGIYIDGSSGIALDESGNPYITGTFQSSTINFGTTTLSNVGADDIFVAKYDTAGNAITAYSAGGVYYDKSSAISMSKAGDLFITGNFSSDALPFGTSTLLNSGSGYTDMFVAKLNPTIGLKENAIIDNKEVMLYPNPNNGSFTISSSANKIESIHIINFLGETIYQSQINEHQSSLRLNGVSAGIYFVHLIDKEQKSITKKIVIQ